jgi:DNA-binding response OmpR family regulator
MRGRLPAIACHTSAPAGANASDHLFQPERLDDEVVARNTNPRRARAVNNSRSLNQHISQLRKRIEIDPKSPIIIRTVHGAGYRFAV